MVNIKATIIDNFKLFKIIGAKLKGIEARLIQKGHYEELVEFAKCVEEGTATPIPIRQLTSATEISFAVDIYNQ